MSTVKSSAITSGNQFMRPFNSPTSCAESNSCQFVEFVASNSKTAMNSTNFHENADSCTGGIHGVTIAREETRRPLAGCPFQSLSLFKSEEDSLHAVPLEPVPLARPQRLVTAQGRLGAPRVARLPAEPRQEEVRL